MGNTPFSCAFYGYCFLKGQFRFNTFDSTFGIDAIAEGCESEVTFAAGAKAHAGSADDVDFCQQLVEEVPGFHVIRRL